MFPSCATAHLEETSLTQSQWPCSYTGREIKNKAIRFKFSILYKTNSTTACNKILESNRGGIMYKTHLMVTEVSGISISLDRNVPPPSSQM